MVSSRRAVAAFAYRSPRRSDMTRRYAEQLSLNAVLAAVGLSVCIASAAHAQPPQSRNRDSTIYVNGSLGVVASTLHFSPVHPPGVYPDYVKISAGQYWHHFVSSGDGPLGDRGVEVAAGFERRLTPLVTMTIGAHLGVVYLRAGPTPGSLTNLALRCGMQIGVPH